MEKTVGTTVTAILKTNFALLTHTRVHVATDYFPQKRLWKGIVKRKTNASRGYLVTQQEFRAFAC